jgi:DNA-binding NarL/FixJ family response regulator
VKQNKYFRQFEKFQELIGIDLDASSKLSNTALSALTCALLLRSTQSGSVRKASRSGDHDMPGIDGMQGLKMLRQKFPLQVIAMLSGRTDAHLVKAALAAGAVGWLPKTLSEEPLLHALRMLAAGGPYVPPEVLAELAKADDRSETIKRRFQELLFALLKWDGVVCEKRRRG